jgi:rRNA-processing protein FCF1
LPSILYVETNFLLACAKGQDLIANALIEAPSTEIQLMIPSVCFMEALSTIEAESRHRKKWINDLRSYRREVGRDLHSSHAVELSSHLEAAAVGSENLLNDIKDRLLTAFGRMATAEQIIPLDPMTIHEGFRFDMLGDPTDSLILSIILMHANRNPAEAKALLSGNHSDFDQPAVKDLLDGASIHYFSKTEAALGWLRSANQ